MRFALRETITLELLHELKQLHPADIIRHTPQCALGRIRHNACCLSVNELVVVAQSSLGNFCLVVLLVNLFDGGSHDTVVTETTVSLSPR